MSSTAQYYPQVTDFINYLTFEKRYSVHTVDAYQTDLEQFFAFLITGYDTPVLTDIQATFVRTWFAELKDDGITAKSIARKASSLKSFFKHQLKMGTIQTSPMLTVSTPKINKRLPEFVQEVDLNTLFNHVEFPDTWGGRTERLVMLLFYSTGMRLSELINLKEKDVDKYKQQLKVLGKGNKERFIPLSKDLVNSLENYIYEKPVSAEKVINLFITEKGKPLQPKSVYVFVHKYLSIITTIKKKSPHIFRHSFATHLMNNGAGLNEVKELLGHSSLASTQVYTHNNIEKLKDIFKKSHPKA